jgi:hypothetical protein
MAFGNRTLQYNGLDYENKHIHVKFEVFTAVTMMNADVWDIKTQFIPHRRHTTSPLKSSSG